MRCQRHPGAEPVVGRRADGSLFAQCPACLICVACDERFVRGHACRPAVDRLLDLLEPHRGQDVRVRVDSMQTRRFAGVERVAGGVVVTLKTRDRP